MISAGADKLLKVWDVASALAAIAAEGSEASVPKLKATAATSAHDKDINAIAVAPNDSLICTASQDRTAKVTDPCGVPTQANAWLHLVVNVGVQSSIVYPYLICVLFAFGVIWAAPNLHTLRMVPMHSCTPPSVLCSATLQGCATVLHC